MGLNRRGILDRDWRHGAPGHLTHRTVTCRLQALGLATGAQVRGAARARHHHDVIATLRRRKRGELEA